jgi:site-specific DNA-methyltransferase (adenine-specific)
MMAYLCMMAVRLPELHRVLKTTGSLYLHCDPTASHYLKLLLDAVFDKVNFRNEIVWKRTSGRKSVSQFGRVHDLLFFYTKGDAKAWNSPTIAQNEDTVRGHDLMRDECGWFRSDNLTGAGQGPARKFNAAVIDPPAGRHWMFDQDGIDRLMAEGRIIFSAKGRPRLKTYVSTLTGVSIGDVWTYIDPLNSAAQERLGYPTQKPVALLERIINAASNSGDLVLDPFCGCGTAVHAAQKLGREWIGIDITSLAIGLIEDRLRRAFPDAKFVVHGTPNDMDGARKLASKDKYQFQWWATRLIPGGVPYGGQKKGADSGIDGLFYFKPDTKTTEKGIISVKGGDNVSVPMVRDLAHVVKRENAEMGVFVSLVEPTKPTLAEAVKEGFYETAFGRFPRLQIVTVDRLLNGEAPRLPPKDDSSIRRAQREDTSKQDALPF